MSETVLVPFKASFLDPTDHSDVTLIAEPVSLGTTMRLSTGQVVKWTEDRMREFAPTFVGAPVNVLLGSDGRPTDHSQDVIGSITKAEYDENLKKIRVYASLWGHYYPETIQTLKELQKSSKIEVSMEFLAAHLDVNSDGSVTPTKGRFSGMGIVGGGADLGNSVLLLASALKADTGEKEEPQKVTTPVTAAPVGSFEWIALKAAEHLANQGTVDKPYNANIVGTFTNTVVYKTDGNDTFRVDYSRENDNITFGEPVKVAETFVPLEASRQDAEPNPQSGVLNMPDEKEFAELKASRDSLETEVKELREIKTQFTELKAQVDKEKADKEMSLKASARVEELEKIRPYDDPKTKEAHLELLKTADDATFESLKKLFASMVELKGGISSEEVNKTPAGDEDPSKAEALKNLETWKAELKASHSTPATK